MGRQTSKELLQQQRQHAIIVDNEGNEQGCEKEDFLVRVEQLLNERVRGEQLRKQDADENQNTIDEIQEGASTFFSSQQENDGKDYWLTHCRGVSAADASAALECLHVVRGCVLQRAAAANSGCAGRLPVYLYALLQCIYREAAAEKSSDVPKKSEGGDAPAASAASRITGGMALLWVLLLQQLSPEYLHKYIHSDSKLLLLLLNATNACSVSEQGAEDATGFSPRPLLLLLTSLHHCFSFQRQRLAGDTSGHGNSTSDSSSRNSNAVADSSKVCSCFPARGVWQRLLQLLTEDARASVRHRARQTAQSLLLVAATEAAGAAATPDTAGAAESARAASSTTGSWKRQQHARASVMACVSELQKYMRTCQSFEGDLRLHHEERIWKKTRFLRVLPLLRRVLAFLLQLPLTGGSSSRQGSRSDEKVDHSSSHENKGSSRHGDADYVQLTRHMEERAQHAHQTLLVAVRDLCMQTALPDSFTVEAAQGVRCVVVALADALQQQQQLRRYGVSTDPQEPQQQQQRRGEEELGKTYCLEGGDFNCVPGLDKLLMLPVAAQLLSRLLQQQCCMGTNPSSRTKWNSNTCVEENSSSGRSGGLWEAASAAADAGATRQRQTGNSSSAPAPAIGTAGAAEYAATWCAALSTALEVLTQWTRPSAAEEVFPYREGGGGSSKALRSRIPLASHQMSSAYGESGNSGKRESGAVASPEDETRETELLLEQLQRLSLLPHVKGGNASGETLLNVGVAGTAGVMEQGALSAATRANACAAGAAADATREAAEGEAAVTDLSAGQQSYARRADLCCRVWRRAMKCLCEGLAVVRDSSVTSAIAAAGKRLVEQATLLELPLLDAAVPYCLALLHYKQKQQWHDALQQAAQLFHSLELVALKQFIRGSPSFPQLQQFAPRTLHQQQHQHKQQQQQHHHHKQQFRQEQQQGSLSDYMDAYADMYREAFEPLLERIVSMLSIVESGALPDNSSNRRSRVMQVNSVHSSSRTEAAEESRALSLAALQRRDMAVYRGDLRSCFAAALHAFTCRVLLSKSLLPLIFFVKVEDLSQTDLVVFDARTAAAQAAESCRISSSGRSQSGEWCSNSWLLPLLPGCLKRDRLGLFAVYFFPLAQQLQQQARHAFTLRKPLQARELCRLQQQVWGLLPGFCCQPLDLARALSSQQGSKLFDTMLQLLHEPVLRQDICASIANLCAAVAVPPCASAAIAGAMDVAALKAASASASSTETESIAAHAEEASKRRAAAMVAVLRSAVQKGCSRSATDDEVATALATVAGSGCCEGRQLLQLRAAPVIGFLVVRYLQLHKLSAVGAGGVADAEAQGTAATSQQQRSFLAAVLLGEKESLENLTQSAKMKAAQHLLRAIKAYAPLCPKELLHANVRRFTSAFLNRATAAAAALGAPVSSAGAEKTKTAAQSSPAATALLGPTESAALVDVTDGLLPVLSEEFSVEAIGLLRDLLAICVEGLKKQPGSQTSLASSAAAGKGQTACSAVEALVHRQVLQVLLRRAYKTLKHVLERSLERLRQFSRQQQQVQQQLHQQQLCQQQLRQRQHLCPDQRLADSGKRPSTVLQEESISAVEDVPCNFSGALPHAEGTRLLSSQLLVDLWKVLEPGRAISWVASAEKARLGCLRVFVCYCLSAQAHAEKTACSAIGGSSRGLTQDPMAVTTTQESAAAEWGALLEKALLPVLVPEILLCLKTPNRVVRDTALDALSAVAEACDDDREKLSNLVLRVAAGLGGCFQGDPPLMKAAAALALSRLVLSFSEEMGKDLVAEVAEVVLVMLEDGNTPAFLGALHFAKVLVHVLDADQLEQFLPTILNLFESKAVTRARMKIRRLLEKLLKKLGDSTVEAAFPKKHLPLLRHLQRRIRKQQLRNLLCNAALQEGLSWEELDFGVNSSSKKEEMRQPAGQSLRHPRKKHAKQRFSDVLEGEEDEDDEETEEDDEEAARGSSSQKSCQKKGVSRPGGKRKASQGDTAADEETEEPAAIPGAKTSGAISVYLREILDAAEGEGLDEKTGGKKRARNRAATGPVSLAEDQAGDTPLDLLSPAAAERVLLSRYTRKRRRQETVYIDGSTAHEATAGEAHADKEEAVYWNEEGRLVVVDEADLNSKQTGKRGASAKTRDAKRQTRSRVRQPVGDNAGEKATESMRPTLSCLAACRAAAKAARRQKRGGHFVQQGGEAFKSKKGRGDVMKNKKIEPFAYIRLNPAMIREKYRPKALKSLSTVFAKPSRCGNISAASRGVHKRFQRRNRRSTKM